MNVECGNWDWGRTFPFLEIHKSKFLFSVLYTVVEKFIFNNNLTKLARYTLLCTVWEFTWYIHVLGWTLCYVMYNYYTSTYEVRTRVSFEGQKFQPHIMQDPPLSVRTAQYFDSTSTEERRGERGGRVWGRGRGRESSRPTICFLYAAQFATV